MATTPIRSFGPTGSSSAAGNTDSNETLRGLNMDEFLKLMIAEMQNQDPLNPLENTEILQQISQIREVGATDKLTKTLEAVLLGQNLSSASGLIGKGVRALTDDGEEVLGIVDSVAIAGGVPRLNVGGRLIGLNNVGEIIPVSSD